MTLGNSKTAPATFARGFSMIDVLVAIVVLATGLLALAALQGALTRNGADSRARSQVAAYTDGLIDQYRSAGYSNLTAGTTTISPNCTAAATRMQAEACAAQTAAGISNLKTTITTTTYYGNTSTGAFASASTAPSDYYGTYDQVHMVTTWTDATGQSRQFASDTIVSPILVDMNNRTLDQTSLLPTSTNTPVVRQYNPGLTAGVIPIAMGDAAGNSTAATNPQPEILGKSNNQFIGGVSYNVLTYGADDGTSNHETQILQNVATRVIRCNCKYGAGISSGIYAQPYRPTYWDASQKKYVSPTKTSSTTSSTGQDPTSEFVNGVYSPNQDTNCNICCRDHNDSDSDTVRFNPWDTALTSKNKHYRWSSTSATTMTQVASGDANAYVNACRLIIVDGVFAVATDLQNYFFGLVGTDTASNAKIPSGSSSTYTASSPLPLSTYSTDYQTFAINYLTSYGGGSTATASSVGTTTILTNSNYPLNSPSGPASGNAASNLYISAGLASSGGVSVPNSIDINYVDPGNNKTASCIPNGTQDCRYLHARGLFVDHLESASLTAINNALSTCSGTIQGCLLPLLPFTTINLTQLADWSEDHSASGAASDIGVTNTALTGGDPDQPLRGVVSALSTGTNSTTDKAVGTIGLSNSGVIGTSLQSGISDSDENTNLTATQVFRLASGGVSATSTLAFNIVLSNPSPNSTNKYAIGLGTNIPSVSWLGVSTYYTSGSSPASLPPCTTTGTTSPDLTETYYLTTKSKCGTTTPNLVTSSNVPTGSTAGVQVTVQNYNVQNPGSSNVTRVTDSQCKVSGVAPTPTTCDVYTISSVKVNGTSVPSWTSAASNTNGTHTGTSSAQCYSSTGTTALTTIQVPSGLSSTSTSSPDSLQIVLTKGSTYTPDQYGNAGGTGGVCSSVGNGKYTYTAYSCCK